MTGGEIMLIDFDVFRKNLNTASEDARYLMWADLFEKTSDEYEIFFSSIVQCHDSLLKILFLRFLEKQTDERAGKLIASLLDDAGHGVFDNAKKAYKNYRNTQKSNYLVKLLPARHARATRFALEQLAQSRDVRHLESIMRFAEKADLEFVPDILFSLQYLPDRRGLDYALDYLDAPDINIRFNALLAVGSLYEARFLFIRHLVVAKINDASDKIRKLALWILQRQNKSRDLKIYLEKSLNDPHPLVRQEAVLGLKAFPLRKAMRHLIFIQHIDQSRSVRLKAQSVLLSYPLGEVERHLSKLIHDHDPRIWKRALIWLSIVSPKNKKVFSFISRKLKSNPDVKIKILLFEALGHLAYPQSIPLLETYLAGNIFESYPAVSALYHIYSFDHVERVNELLCENQINDLVKQVLIKLVVVKYLKQEKLKPVFKKVVQGYLNCENINIRYYAFLAVKEISTPDFLPFLLEAFAREKDDSIKDIICQAIHSIALQHFQDVQDFFVSSENDFDSKFFLVSVLVSSSEALPILEKLTPAIQLLFAQESFHQKEGMKFVEMWVMQRKIELKMALQWFKKDEQLISFLRLFEWDQASHLKIEQSLPDHVIEKICLQTSSEALQPLLRSWLGENPHRKQWRLLADILMKGPAQKLALAMRELIFKHQAGVAIHD